MRRQKGMMTSQEVADMLDVELSYLYYLRRTNQLLPVEQKTVQTKPRLRYRRSDVEAYQERQAQKAKEADFRHQRIAS